jgi:hypothetical protein
MNRSELTQHLLSPLGYLLGMAAVVAVPLLFGGMGVWSDEFARLPFMRNHPRYSGGEIVNSLQGADATWTIHRPVFDGLVGERTDGFVQIDVISRGAEVSERLDLDGDAVPDATLLLSNDAGPRLSGFSAPVTGIQTWGRTEDGWIVRIGLRRD